MAEPNGNGNGKLNTAPLLTVIAILIGLGTVGAGAHFAFIRPLERQLDANSARLDRIVESEQARNNAVEQRIAREEAVTELFKSGKLRLEGGQ